MSATTEVNLQKVKVSRAMSVYPLLGRAYLIKPYAADMSPTLVKTGKNYYDSQEILEALIKDGKLPQGTRFSTASEELALQKSYEMQDKDPRKAEEFKDHMGKGKQDYVCGHTLTGLRVPKGWEEGKKDNGTGKYPRIFLIGDDEKEKFKFLQAGIL